MIKLPYQLHVGWLRGKINRQAMISWCEQQWPQELSWSFMKGGLWFFAREEQATLFALTWVDQNVDFEKLPYFFEDS